MKIILFILAFIVLCCFWGHAPDPEFYDREGQVPEDGGVPANCRECMFTHHCQSWYGGSTCLYRKEINQHDH